MIMKGKVGKVLIQSIIVAMLAGCSAAEANIKTEPTHTIYTDKQNDEHQPSPSKGEAGDSINWDEYVNDEFVERLKWEENIWIKDDGFSRNYVWKDNAYFYEFTNKDVTISFPLISEDGFSSYTIKKGERQGEFYWQHTYYPTTLNYLSPKLVDVTGDGIENLCIGMGVGSGTGVSVSVMHVVDLSTMKEIPILENNFVGEFTTEDAVIIRDFLKKEKEKREELKFLDDTPKTNYSIRNIGIEDNSIKVNIGILNYEEFVSGDPVGEVEGEYVYNGQGFTLCNLIFKPYEE
ncbi:hypothetical protein [Acetivibrio clariflavus]|uniref:Lipoprotein n=1 Tax=Acetivibrio clariflavus (strain DSM 19732 / NBRC 101661 / EBR45) TaxID=720554 RepID=G8LXF1_ACECE|nr:hypothetical protein [Acetivibrio clariflavus]AEV69869.1 hypothetical protein Clocl_3371 [Acetivibrio clariflavus DSM 19732]